MFYHLHLIDFVLFSQQKKLYGGGCLKLLVNLHCISAYKLGHCIELFIGYVIILMDVLHLVTGDET